LASEFIDVSCRLVRALPKYHINFVAVQHFLGAAMFLLLTVVGWLYVALMMAVAEANHPQGSLLGAMFTFLLYGAGPVALIVYLMGRSARRRARRKREQGEAVGSGEPDAGGEAPADAVAPVRKEP
jgi:hypothetical protein